MSAPPPKADIRATQRHVRFGPKSDIGCGEIRAPDARDDMVALASSRLFPANDEEVESEPFGRPKMFAWNPTGAIPEKLWLRGRQSQCEL